LRRGRRGTEAAIGTQRVGDRFVLIEQDSITAVDLPAGAAASTVRVLATGIADTEPAEARLTLSGASLLPPAPVHLTATRELDGGLTLRWVRRSRSGWRWVDAVDAPLAEEREAYAVTVAGIAGEQTFETAASTLRLAAGTMPAGRCTISVRQLGTWGASAAATIMVEGTAG
jgi:hypothetical protein